MYDDTHEHILYKMRGVKACHILFYVPPAAALQGVTILCMMYDIYIYIHTYIYIYIYDL